MFTVSIALFKTALDYKIVTILSPPLYRVFIYLFGVLRRFQHCTGHTTTGSWKGRGNQYIEFVRDLYCKLPTKGKQLPAFTLEVVPGTEPWPQRWEARMLPLYHRGPSFTEYDSVIFCIFIALNLCQEDSKVHHQNPI